MMLRHTRFHGGCPPPTLGTFQVILYWRRKGEERGPTGPHRTPNLASLKGASTQPCSLLLPSGFGYMLTKALRKLSKARFSSVVMVTRRGK